MKKMIVAMAVAFVATTASAAISGSSHDFTVAGGGSTCAYCHMPHNSPYNSTNAPGAPLWARNIDYSQSWTMYSSNVTGRTVPAATPNPGSRLCLSCHDGTQSISVVFQANGTGTQLAGTTDLNNPTSVAAGTRVGTDLSNDHPVSVVYNTTAIFGLTSTPDAVFNIATVGTSTVECTSCHNAHSGRGFANGGASAYPNRQFMANFNGDFCGGCHANK